MSDRANIHGGDRVAGVLGAHGVRFLFTLCGGHISPILSGSRARGLRVIDVRHEATAVFAADAVARLSGVPGVAAVTAGPGLTNTITALKNAQLAQAPLVLLGGAAPTLLQGRGALQDIDQMPLVEPHVKLAWRVRRVRELAPTLEQAFAVALAGVPGPVFVECPIDLLYPEATIREWYGAAGRKGTALKDRLLAWYLHRHVERMFDVSPADSSTGPRPVAVPRPRIEPIAAAIGALSRAERPVLVVGSQALAAAREAPQVAEAIARLGVPTYLSGMARGLLGREHALQLRHQRRQSLREADCVVLAGVPCDFRLDYGRHISRGARLIALNRSLRDAKLNRRPDILVHGDAGVALRQIAAGLEPQKQRWSSWLEELRTRDQQRETEIVAQASRPSQFLNPLALCRAIEHAVAEDGVMVADGGDFVATASYVVRPRGPLSWLDPGVFGTLGVGAGFALAASLLRPDSEVWLLYGDGACGYSIAEFDTFARHGLPVIAVVGNDAGWTQIAREQVKILSDDVATVLGRTAYHDVAAAFGAEGLLLRNAEDTRRILQQAKQVAAARRPVLVNAWLDRTDFREGSISM